MSKPVESKKPEAQPTSSKSSGGVGAKVGCGYSGCKSNPERHEFCREHFNQYKFGLINKHGQPVPDFEKKFEHYQKWLRAQKVA